jgi:hypothetical protein
MPSLTVGLLTLNKEYDDNNNRDDLIANGIVELSPDWLECKGSKWVLRIDKDGIYNESEKCEFAKKMHELTNSKQNNSLQTLSQKS